MRKFILKILVFLLLLTSLIFSLIRYYSSRIEGMTFRNYETESNLFLIGKDQHYEYVFMGISHARNFSRHKNHLRMEEILGGKILNLGRGGGFIGTAAEHAYLKYFYSMGNKTEHLIYVLSPPMLFSENLEQNPGAFQDEPFKPRFMFQYLTSNGRNVPKQLYFYLYSKMGKRYQHQAPWSADSMTLSLPEIDTHAINEGLKLAYPQGLDMDVYKRNIKILEKSFALAHDKGAEISVIFTPTLFGHWPGHKLVLESLHTMQAQIPFSIFDYSDVLQQPELFSDHHHLNSKGISLLVTNYIKPDIQKKN